jgi:hypothetical protein
VIAFLQVRQVFFLFVFLVPEYFLTCSCYPRVLPALRHCFDFDCKATAAEGGTLGLELPNLWCSLRWICLCLPGERSCIVVQASSDHVWTQRTVNNDIISLICIHTAKVTAFRLLHYVHTL